MTAWPRALHAAVRKWGAEAVWGAGLLALEYPPTWAETGKEIMTINRQLTIGNNDRR